MIRSATTFFFVVPIALPWVCDMMTIENTSRMRHRSEIAP